MDGFFRIAFTGTVGTGFGILVLHKGIIVGADVGGATYNGTYTEDEKMLLFDVAMEAPAGLIPVQTGIPITTPLRVPIAGSIAKTNIDTDVPTLLSTPLGPINILFRKIRNYPSGEDGPTERRA